MPRLHHWAASRRFIRPFGGGDGRVEIDAADPDSQTLLVWYPEVEPRDDTYVRPAVKIESGAKSALDPHRSVIVRPYVADEAAGLDLVVPDVTTIEPGRTFWDKVVIAHGLRSWFERRGMLRQEPAANLLLHGPPRALVAPG